MSPFGFCESGLGRGGLGVLGCPDGSAYNALTNDRDVIECRKLPNPPVRLRWFALGSGSLPKTSSGGC